MNQSLYRADCPACGKHLRAGISFNIEGTMPPPAILVGCGCERPPVPVTLVYYGHHSSENKTNDVHWADKPG